ncbi:MAG TPA: phosphopantothenoylcysteine decarboxylase, partial [Solirubrobacteraceae bacterium]|nr:phosphopantothenoylcysteine decarboxylase [Solirubrobacteraceae bacterium]
LLRERGARILEPEEGRLASKGEHGIGRLMEPALILAECEALLAGSSSTAGARGTRGTEGRGSWEGVRVLVTAGGTREAIDSVRFLGNSSSGRMGLALAQAARARGAEVSVIAANVSLPRPEGVEWQEVVSAGELEDACKARFPECEILLMAAAVADYRPTEPLARKLKKHEHDRVHLELESTPDVLAGLAAARTPSQTLVGFAAEHGEGAVERGRGKLKMKCLDAVVVNDISRADIGFESESNEVTIVTAEGEEHLPRAPKASIAEAILDAVERLRLDRSLEGDV